MLIFYILIFSCSINNLLFVIFVLMIYEDVVLHINESLTLYMHLMRVPGNVGPWVCLIQIALV